MSKKTIVGLSKTDHCDQFGHNLMPVAQGYSKYEKSRLTSSGLAPVQGKSYIMLVCTKCGQTLEICIETKLG